LQIDETVGAANTAIAAADGTDCLGTVVDTHVQSPFRPSDHTGGVTYDMDGPDRGEAHSFEFMSDLSEYNDVDYSGRIVTCM